MNVLLDGYRQLPRPGHVLDDYVALLNTTLEELRLGPGKEGLDDAVVPPGSYDANSKPTSIVVLRCGSFVMHDDGRAGCFG